MERIYSNKIKIIILIVIFLLIAVISGYIFYMNKTVKVELQEMEPINTEADLPGTWWTTVFDENHSISKDYNIELPKVDFTKNNLIISAGREIKSLTYTRKSKYTLPYKGHPYVGDVILKRQLYAHKFFVYKIDKLYILDDDINWPDVKIE